MPALSAASVGPLNAVLLMSGTPIPLHLAAIALVMAETIWETTEVCEPTHENEVPVREQKSWQPKIVAVKNGFVVTWLSITKWYFGCFAKNGWSLLRR